MQKALFFFFSVYSLTANSQITKKNVMLGGSISYASTKYNSTNYGYLTQDTVFR